MEDTMGGSMVVHLVDWLVSKLDYAPAVNSAARMVGARDQKTGKLLVVLMDIEKEIEMVEGSVVEWADEMGQKKGAWLVHR
jgi:hypothetical protein